MPFELESRMVGNVCVMTCKGRLVGGESAALERQIDALLPHSPRIVLHLADVSFIDSSGLGLLVRYLARVRQAGGSLKLCALSPRLEEALRVTRIASSFDIHATDDEAVTAFYRGSGERQPAMSVETDVLVAEPSLDVQAYLRELLRQGGFGATTAGNLPDALVLMRAIQPRAVVIGAGLRAARSTATAETFNRLADEIGVVELPADFSSRDAGEAGDRLLDQVRTILAARR